MNMEKNVEDTIIKHLTINKKAYTRSLYKLCGGRQCGYTLNKFRKYLDKLCNDGLIKYNNEDYPYWSI